MFFFRLASNFCIAQQNQGTTPKLNAYMVLVPLIPVIGRTKGSQRNRVRQLAKGRLRSVSRSDAGVPLLLSVAYSHPADQDSAAWWQAANYRLGSRLLHPFQ